MDVNHLLNHPAEEEVCYTPTEEDIINDITRQNNDGGVEIDDDDSHELALMDPNEQAKDIMYQKLGEEHKLGKLLMALYDDFENPRSSILHRSLLLTVSITVYELLVEETHLKSFCLMSHLGSSQVFATDNQSSLNISSLIVEAAQILGVSASSGAQLHH
ncbi:hypothetical protein Dsin_029961 [Dipteronia sinensis]|uniref:Uncharacterized protein n=1 Tax=Dipteronia sinensis TaxID=43782 RepID=A0AAE0DRZ9_9ROSI|nr:hypothetical protein Dsin_029961 [Dipteronia sinensis]